MKLIYSIYFLVMLFFARPLNGFTSRCTCFIDFLINQNAKYYLYCIILGMLFWYI